MSDVVVLKVDVDDCEDVAAEYKVVIFYMIPQQRLNLREICFSDHRNADLHLLQEQGQGSRPDWRQCGQAEGDCRRQQVDGPQ